MRRLVAHKSGVHRHACKPHLYLSFPGPACIRHTPSTAYPHAYRRTRSSLILDSPRAMLTIPLHYRTRLFIQWLTSWLSYRSRTLPCPPAPHACSLSLARDCRSESGWAPRCCPRPLPAQQAAHQPRANRGGAEAGVQGACDSSVISPTPRLARFLAHSPTICTSRYSNLSSQTRYPSILASRS